MQNAWRHAQRSLSLIMALVAGIVSGCEYHRAMRCEDVILSEIADGVFLYEMAYGARPSVSSFEDLVKSLEGGNPRGLQFILVSSPIHECHPVYTSLKGRISGLSMDTRSIVFHFDGGKSRAVSLPNMSKP
jgi:hypothetical protein